LTAGLLRPVRARESHDRTAVHPESSVQMLSLESVCVRSSVGPPIAPCLHAGLLKTDRRSGARTCCVCHTCACTTAMTWAAVPRATSDFMQMTPLFRAIASRFTYRTLLVGFAVLAVVLMNRGSSQPLVHASSTTISNENTKAGAVDWDITGAGDPDI